MRTSADIQIAHKIQTPFPKPKASEAGSILPVFELDPTLWNQVLVRLSDHMNLRT
jgi:hypothetical protein